MSMITIRNLQFQYDAAPEINALYGIDLEIRKGEILWLKCSGCGKRHEMTGTQFKNIRDRSNGKLYCRKCGDWMPVHPCAHPKEGGDGNG